MTISPKIRPYFCIGCDMDKKHFLYLCIAQFAIGITVVSVKTLVPFIPISFLLFIRFGCSGLLLLGLCFHQKKSIRKNAYGNKLSFNDIVLLSIQALCGGFLFNMLMMNGLRYTSASAAGIISSTTPAMIAILSIWLLKEQLNSKKIATIALAMLGILFMHLGEIGDHETTSNLFGNFLVLLAVIPEAMFTILAKKHQLGIHPIVSAALSNLLNALFFVPLVLSILPTVFELHIDLFQWIQIALMILGGILFYTYWYLGVPNTPAATAAVTTAIAPLSITLLATIFLGESLTLISCMGMLLVLLSILYGSNVPLKQFLKKTVPSE